MESSIFLFSSQIISHVTTAETNARLLVCSTYMFKALSVLQIFMLCYSLHLLLMNIMLYGTHTVLIRTSYYFVSLLTQNTKVKALLIPHVTQFLNIPPHCGSYGQSQNVDLSG